ncbi:iron complex outermembrane recepter protein [Sphingomonas sp. YR710]|uniref:TonB-dependent receptor n=1 Tax=Sphingomonas sp. YR710 TaxID=1882773 RepID=UPI0008891B01|nr:TonB-dependent receptor [Sphingomonas sp. YR710]SDD60928.1 iron complex outermembrane recepter protein [Sphingomonas sp. YR710]
MRMRIHLLRQCLSCIALASFAASAQAQDNGSPPKDSRASDEKEVGAGEIVVTAQRREQRLTEVPISVQAVTSETLGRSVVISSQDVLKLTPSVNFTGGYAATASSVAIRGINSAAVTGEVQPSTAVLVDDVALSRQAEFVADFNDIERVEVLRGPQGTLFGKNATAGVINITTKRPTSTYDASFEAGYTTDNQLLLRGMANIPLSDTVRTRFNVYRNTLSPIAPNKDPNHLGDWNRGFGAIDNWGAAGKIAIDFAEGVNLLVSGDYAKSRDSFGSTVILAPDTNPFLGAIQTAAGVVATRNHPFVNVETVFDGRATAWGLSANLGIKLTDDLTLRSITGHRDFYYDTFGDFDSGPWGAVQGVGMLPNPLGYPIQTVTLANGGFPYKPTSSRYTSEEVRLNYSSGPLDIVGGGYAQWYTGRNINTQVTFIANFGAGPGYFSNFITTKLNDDIYSLYGDATYKLFDNISLFGGLRYSVEKIDFDYDRKSWAGAPFDPLTFAPTTGPSSTLAFSTSDTRHNLSGRAGLRYAPNADHSYYVSFNRGYKGPAVDTTSASTAATAILKPEIATAYEVGMKHAFFDNKLYANLAVYYQRVKDIQQGQLPPGGITTLLLNAGDIRSYGVEFDFIAKPTPAFRIEGGGAYTNAVYRNFTNSCYPGQTAAQGCIAGRQDLDGTQALGQPKWSLNIAGTYDVTLPDSIPFNAFLRASYGWQSHVIYGLTNDPMRVDPGHGMLDATLGLVGKKNHWQLLLYGKNLTNEIYYTYLNESDNFIGRVSGNIARDAFRYGGVMLKVSM